ncbi:head completion/stabilization protein, partial [Pseudomonas viridiflava]|uniref:head completion/stabilization protein n=2 Tax=Pseudomonas TaxID=286 RepID=UPI000F02312A
MSFSGKPTVLVDERIQNDGFWPDLSVAEFQKGYRLPAEYLVEMLTADLTMAMVEVNTDLAKLKARWQGAGVSNVESADTTVLPERTFQAATYKRAVYSRAKASLLTQF